MIEFEYDTKVIPVDTGLEEELKKLAAEGWQLSPEVKPFITYNLVRVKAKGDAMTAIPKMVIDESKIFIMRDGKLIQ